MASANGGVAMPSYNIRYVVLLLSDYLLLQQILMNFSNMSLL